MTKVWRPASNAIWRSAMRAAGMRHSATGLRWRVYGIRLASGKWYYSTGPAVPRHVR